MHQYKNDNLVEIDKLDDPTASLQLALFGFNTANNKVVYRKKTGGFGTATISKNGTNNIVKYEDFTLTETTTSISEVSCLALNGTGTVLLIANVVSLAAGDNLRAQVFQNSGGSLNLATNRVSVNRVG